MAKYCIIGTGRQGTAALYDIIMHADVSDILLIDSKQSSIEKCLYKMSKFLKENINIDTQVVNIEDKKALINLLQSYDIMLSAVPYFYNIILTEVAIKSSTSMVDLGGHTENVIKQLSFDKLAKDKGISIVPDCGMGPGMNISMALLAMEQLDKPQDVYIWDGGLPLHPKPPWNYSLFFNINGLTNEYDTNAYFLKNSKINEVECFSNLEDVYFDGIGTLEAAVTCGGLSTMPWSYEGKLNTLENKTLRYKGHWDTMVAYRQLGLFEENKIKFDGFNISPREFYHHLLEKKLKINKNDDICIMRTEAYGLKNDIDTGYRCEVIEKFDYKTGLMAMEKWTGWHATIVMSKIIDGTIKPGTHPIEKAISGTLFYEEALKRGYKIKITEIN